MENPGPNFSEDPFPQTLTSRQTHAVCRLHFIWGYDKGKKDSLLKLLFGID